MNEPTPAWHAAIPRRISPLRLALRGLLLAALWALLTHGDPASWIIGLPAVVASVWITLLLEPPNVRWPQPTGLLGFVPWFVKASVLAGVDVAQRAFSPTLQLAPAMLHYRPRLPEGAPRIFFANCISLLPGTLTADWEGTVLSIHVIDETLDNHGDLQRLEQRVARLFGIDLAASGAEEQAK